MAAKAAGGVVASLRRFVSAEGRVVNLTILITLMLLLIWTAIHVARGPEVSWIGLFVVVLLALIFLASKRFSSRLIRIALLLGVAILLLGLVSLGRDATGLRRAREARRTATELGVRLDDVVRRDPTDRTKADAPARGADPKALADLKALLAQRPTDAMTATLRDVVEQLGEVLSRPSDKDLLTPLQQTITALDDAGLRAKADEAVKAVAAALAPPATPGASAAKADAIRAVTELCVASGGKETLPCTKNKNKDETETELSKLDVLAAEADFKIARYEQAIATGDPDNKLATKVDEKLTAYAEASGKTTRGIEHVDAVDALQAGASEVAGAVPGVGTFSGDGDEGKRVPAALGVLGWILLGALVLALYRSAERRTTARGLGPVTVKGAKDGDATIEQFRTYLLRNIPDPAAVPGAAALIPLTDLLGVTTVPVATLISKVVTALTSAVNQSSGYTVDCVVVAPAASKADADEKGTKAKVKEAEPGKNAATSDKPRTAISVRVSRTRTGELVDQRLVHDKDGTEALRKAAYWAASIILNHSDRVPHWARWPVGTSDALATYHAAEDQGTPDLPLKCLIEAVRKAPSSSLLCLKLSHAYALEGRHLDAFEMALRAVAVNRHYVAGRYRLAMAASLVASDIDGNWREQPAAQQARVTDALRRYSRRGVSLASALDPPAPATLAPGAIDPAVTALCAFSVKELDEVKDLLNLFMVAFRALRRSERAYWLDFLRTKDGRVSARRQFMRTTDSARPAIMLRGDIAMGDDYSDLLEARYTFWQVAYNLACYDAIRADGGDPDGAERSLCRLESALERPGSHQLKQSWVKVDPDLKPLRELARFKEFQALLDDDRSDDAAGS